MKTWALLFLISLPSFALELRRWNADPGALKKDLELIEDKANWSSHPLTFSMESGETNEVTINCSETEIRLDVTSRPEEAVATLYHGVFHLGFLFPHPRMQISPKLSEARKNCGKTFEWRPSFKVRGFHFHTLHPSEFMEGFLDGKTEIALDTIRWLARNRQNVFDVSLLRRDWDKEVESLKKPFALAKELGITRGVALGIIFSQQNSFKLLSMTRLYSHLGNKGPIKRNLRSLREEVDFDYLDIESGSSEFTSVSYHKSLDWINLISEEARDEGIKVFAKIHVSSNQVSKTWGNFNFLPGYATDELGLLPHTVGFYGLYDESAPMYGNKNFAHILNFMREQKARKEVWYYPETSYWVFMDMDVPLLLTDYLRARAVDMKNIHAEGIPGHLNFTTGQEAGYWLFDWNLTLNTDLDNNFDPQSGLKLLGEDTKVWQKILDFQTEHFKKNELISILTFSNVMDELLPGSRVHSRNTAKELSKSPIKREDEILRLENALNDLPELGGVKNNELKAILEVTHLRIKHALSIRKALRFDLKSSKRADLLSLASSFRKRALVIMKEVAKKTRYPETKIFERKKNLTSYHYGYLWQAASLTNWEREELMVQKNKYSPFFMNHVNILDIMF